MLAEWVSADSGASDVYVGDEGSVALEDFVSDYYVTAEYVDVAVCEGGFGALLVEGY